MEHEQRIAVMIAELYASGYNGAKSKKYHGLLVYNEESFNTDVDEEPLLGWIVATTQQAAGGGKYVALLDYGADLIITTLDHTLGDGATECLAPQCPCDPVPSGPSAK